MTYSYYGVSIFSTYTILPAFSLIRNRTELLPIETLPRFTYPILSFAERNGRFRNKDLPYGRSFVFFDV